MQEVDIEEAKKTFQKYKSEVKANITTTSFSILFLLVVLLCLTIEIRWLEIILVIFITVATIFNIISVVKNVKLYLEHKKTFETLYNAVMFIEKILHKCD